MKKHAFLPYFNRQQRRGILILVGSIIVLQIIIWKSDAIFSTPSYSETIPENLQKQYDSLKKHSLQQQKKKIYPFSPNYLTDYKGFYLGMSIQQIDRVLAFRKAGRYFKSKEEFKKIAGLSDSLFEILKPYIKIPAYKTFINTKNLHQISSYDLNLATADDFQSINGIGKVLSGRIVKYRRSIGGFHSPDQLSKVYGLTPEIVKAVLSKFKINETGLNSKKNITKKAVNIATAADFKMVPGIGDKLADRIIKYRKKIKGFTITEQLNDVYGLSPEVKQQFWQYFKIEQPASIPFIINLNEANIKELAKNPYISYTLAKQIISFRTLHGPFNTLNSLKQISGYPKNRHRQICLYLKL